MKGRTLRGRRGREAFVLPMAATIGIALALLMSSALDFIQARSRDMGAIRTRAEVTPVLRSHLNQLVVALLAAERTGVGATLPEAIASDLLATSERRIYFDGTPVVLGKDGHEVEASVLDESAVFSLNAMLPAELAGWLRSRGVAQQLAERLADEIVDFRDVDQARRLRGAEIDEYLRAGRRPPKDRLFAQAAELGSVLSFREVEPLLGYDTLLMLGFEPDVRINVNAASREVLTGVVGMSASNAERLIQRRRQRAIWPVELEQFGVFSGINERVKTWPGTRLRITLRDRRTGIVLRRTIRLEPPQGIALSETMREVLGDRPRLLFETVDAF